MSGTSRVAGLGCSPPKPLRAANLGEQPQMGGDRVTGVDFAASMIAQARLSGQVAPRLAPKMRADPSTLVPQVSAALPLVIKFARDSPLEQSGFELWVPPACDAPGSHKVRC